MSERNRSCPNRYDRPIDVPKNQYEAAYNYANPEADKLLDQAKSIESMLIAIGKRAEQLRKVLLDLDQVFAGLNADAGYSKELGKPLTE